MDQVRETIRQAIKGKQMTLRAASEAIGRNPAYLQQFLERGVPRALPEDTRAALARILDVDERALRPSRKPSPAADEGNHARHPDGASINESLGKMKEDSGVEVSTMSPEISQRMQRISRLPIKDQAMVLEVIDRLCDSAGVVEEPARRPPQTAGT